MGHVGWAPGSCPGPSASVMTSSFTYTDALTILVTVETLVFAALAVVVSFGLPSSRLPKLPISIFKLGLLAVGFVTAIAFGAFMAWWSIFIGHWPTHFQPEATAAAIAAAIVGQPGFAALLACGLRPAG